MLKAKRSKIGPKSIFCIVMLLVAGVCQGMFFNKKTVLIQPVRLEKFVEFHGNHNRLSPAERWMYYGEFSLFKKTVRFDVSTLWEEYIEAKNNEDLNDVRKRELQEKILKDIREVINYIFEKFADAREQDLREMNLTYMTVKDIEKFVNKFLRIDSTFKNKIRSCFFWSSYADFIYPKAVQDYLRNNMKNNEIAEMYGNIQNGYDLVLALGKAYADCFTPENLRIKEQTFYDIIDSEPTPYIMINKHKNGNVKLVSFPRWNEDVLCRRVDLEKAVSEANPVFSDDYFKWVKVQWISGNRVICVLCVCGFVYWFCVKLASKFQEAKQNFTGEVVPFAWKKSHFQKCFGYIPEDVKNGDVPGIEYGHIKDAYLKMEQEHKPDACFLGAYHSLCREAQLEKLRQMNKCCDGLIKGGCVKRFLKK